MSLLHGQGNEKLVMSIEADQWDIERITDWMRQHIRPFTRT
jgi:hypothetical protein